MPNTRLQDTGRPYLVWAYINDFTAGIVQRPYGGQQTSYELGNNLAYTITSIDKPSAQFNGKPGTGTRGCIANPNGGLQPLPLLAYGDGITPSITDTVNPPNADTIDYYGTLSQMIFPGSLGGDFVDAIYYVIQYVDVGGATSETELREIFLFNISNNPFAYFTATSTGSSAIYWYNGPMVYYYDDSGPIIALLCFSSQNPSTGFAPGLALVPSTGGILATLGTGVQGWFFSHQGRILFVNQSAGAYNNANINTISFTDPPESATLGTQQTVVVPVNFDDITSFGSLSSGELLLLCRQYGGVIISGDIFEPTITTVPGVQGTQGLAGAGLITPIGMVYLSGGSGAWAWAGGSTSNKISAQLDNNFYDVMDDQYLFQLTQFDNWILFPNNWIYDMISSSWWQLPYNSAYQYFLYAIANINGTNLTAPAICAFPVVTTSIPEYLSVMSYANGYSDYTWISNPMIVSNGEMVDIRELVVTYTADTDAATITITLYAIDPATSLSESFTTVNTQTNADINKPQQQRIQFYLQTDIVVLSIDVSGAEGNAVNIDQVSLAYETRFHLATV